MTCWLVTISPLARSITTPEPRFIPPSLANDCVRMLTTAGETACVARRNNSEARARVPAWSSLARASEAARARPDS